MKMKDYDNIEEQFRKVGENEKKKLIKNVKFRMRNKKERTRCIIDDASNATVKNTKLGKQRVEEEKEIKNFY